MANAAKPIEHWLDDSADCAARAAFRVAEILRGAIAARGTAAFAVSGGRSPIAFFHRLSEQPLAWEKISVTLVDERWVAPDSEHSNEHLVRQHLLRGAAKSARFVPLKTAVNSPHLALTDREYVIAQLHWPLDVIVLGMGEDGHTASLFPGADNLLEAMNIAEPARLCAITPPHAEHRRISLTLRALLESRNLVLLIQNSRKREIYQSALVQTDVVQLPIAAVLQQRHVPVEVFWSP